MGAQPELQNLDGVVEDQDITIVGEMQTAGIDITGWDLEFVLYNSKNEVTLTRSTDDANLTIIDATHASVTLTLEEIQTPDLYHWKFRRVAPVGSRRILARGYLPIEREFP